MNIALFGGTFDPIHNGHLRAARQATQMFNLDRVLFVPSGGPPHKPRNRVTPFAHRLAMVALACAGNPQFIPSLLEAAEGRLQYSVDTLKRVRKTLRPKDRLFFLSGVDAFLDLPQWKSPGRLLGLADFIVVSRPGFRLEEIFRVVRPYLAIKGAAERAKKNSWNGARQTIRLKHSRVHILTGVNVPVASHEIRAALARGHSPAGLLSPLVEEYIMKEQLYKVGRKFGR
ncbi:MAG: nicotinate-nucleotide adenylyltransferase [Terriglobia bacterium]